MKFPSTIQAQQFTTTVNADKNEVAVKADQFVTRVGTSAVGEPTLALNVGGGAEVLRDKTGHTLNFRTLVGLGLVGAAVNGDEVELRLLGTLAQLNAALTDSDIWPGRGTSIADISIGADDKYWVGKTPFAMTVREINTLLQGTTPTVDWELRFGPDIALAGTLVHSATASASTTGDNITAIGGTALIPAGNHVWYKFTAFTGTPVAFNSQIRI